MNTHYTTFRNTLILISLLKQHGINQIIASPGTSNMPFVASVQQDEFFKVYSCIDERSAAYMACGMAAESGKPVVISCTGATASRNYMSALTEAYYRKLPILAVTSTQDISKLGQNSPQLIDRRSLPNDIAKLSIHIPEIHTDYEERNYAVQINTAILELTRDRGEGPAHINLTIPDGVKEYTETKLPNVRMIKRISDGDQFPKIPKGKIGVYLGAHKVWDKTLVSAVESFCECYNAVVLEDHIGNYHGRYAVFCNIVTYQGKRNPDLMNMDLMIHLGDIDGSDYQGLNPSEVWRVNPDGEVRSTFGKLTYVFEMTELSFFQVMVNNKAKKDTTYYEDWNNEILQIRSKIPDLPFSNIWIARKTIGRLPKGSCLHFSIQNSLRSWNFFDTPQNIDCYCNTGGFGIDGNVSSLIGASLVNKDRLYFGIIGDLAFFYDLNSLGNRHIENNIRIMLINNNGGQQFRNTDSSGFQFGKDINAYMAAGGHYGNQSHTLVKSYAESLGFEYICATSKEEYLSNCEIFISPDERIKPILFEVFLNEEDETEAMNMIVHIEEGTLQKGKKLMANIVGDDAVNAIVKFLKR